MTPRQHRDLCHRLNLIVYLLFALLVFVIGLVFGVLSAQAADLQVIDPVRFALPTPTIQLGEHVKIDTGTGRVWTDLPPYEASYFFWVTLAQALPDVRDGICHPTKAP